MATPAGLKLWIATTSTPLHGLGSTPDSPTGASDATPAQVEGTWDEYLNAIGRTVPVNVTRAKTATGRLMAAVR